MSTAQVQGLKKPQPLKPLRIGALTLKAPTILAPMAGVTDRQFRLLLRRHGDIGLVTMEFISSEGLARGDRHTLKLLHFREEERPLSIQIYGREAQPMADAAAHVNDMGADVCDINMGCPANKILKGCSGCALMGDLDRAAQIIRACRKRLSIPLSVKFRTGLLAHDPKFLELGHICQEEGVDAVTLHPRTADQGYRGSANWNHIGELKSALKIPVIGNGDIAQPQDALRMMQQTGCDGVMIGRASMKNPWIYRQIWALLQGRPATLPTLEQRRRWILNHFAMLLNEESARDAIHKLRIFTGWYTKGLPDGRKLRLQIQHLESPEDFIEAIEKFFEHTTQAA